MIETVHRFCVLAVFCGTALRLAPEGTVRRLLSVLVTAVLLHSVFHCFGFSRDDILIKGIAGLREYEKRFSEKETDVRDRMDRMVIEQELCTYILNKAAQEKLGLRSVSVELRWQTDGYWLPWSLRMSGVGGGTLRAAFQRELEAELGVPLERQQWVDEDGLEESADSS